MDRKRYKTSKAPKPPKSEKEKARKHRHTKPRPADKPLTEKQSRFAAAFMKNRSLREAALIAGYSPLNPSQSGLQALKGRTSPRYEIHSSEEVDPAAKEWRPESKSPTLDFSKWGFAWAEFNPV